jgi:TRAP-type C4-dicarboxylate transport system substrate-binding protein
LKRGILFILVSIALVTLLLFTACAETAPTQVIELKYSNFFPATHLNSILAQKWCDEIKAQTKGAVNITYYPGGTLTPAPKIYDGVVTGISDIGMSALSYTVGRFPASEVVDLPHGYPSGWVATQVANDFYGKFKPKEFDDTRVLYFHAHGPGVLLTVKKPVNTLEDVKGLVIRSTGIGAQVAEALGAKGYAAAQGEAYELMSKGTIDGSYTPLEVLKGWKQAEVVKYVTNCYKMGYTTDFFIVMNKAKWDSLPGNIKDVFNKVNGDWVEKHAKVWSYYDKVALDYFLTFPERKVIELPESEMARWVAAAMPLLDGYVKDKTGKGLPAAEYQKYLAERIKDWSGKSPSAKDCVDWVEKNLQPK